MSGTIFAGNVTSSYEYDGNGNITKITDALGHATVLAYDALDRITTSRDAVNGVTMFGYDAANRIVQATDPRGNATRYTYDGFGQLWQQISPDTGTTSFTYNGQGLPLSRTRADGVQATYGYDALYRRIKVSAGGLTQTATYDSCANGLGRLCSTGDATGTTSYTYTPEGDISGRGFTMGGVTYALGYGYDNFGRLANVLYPDGKRANYTYANGVVGNVSLTMGPTTSDVATSLAYLPGTQAMAAWTSSNGAHLL